MSNNLTDLENKVLELRQEKGYTIEETKKELNITDKVFKNAIENLKEAGDYDEEKIKQAKKNKKRREYEKKNRNRTKLPPDEEEYRQKCIDFMCRRYFEYNQTKKLNPLLVSKIQSLNKVASYKIIYNTMKNQQKNLDYANIKFKNYSSDFQKINYMLAIVKNNLNITYKRLKRKETVQEAENNRFDVQDMLRKLDKNTTSKPTQRIDMSQWLD